MSKVEKRKMLSWDERRKILVPGNERETLFYAAKEFADLAIYYIQKKDRFTVALSGGSTPKKIYQKLLSEYAKKVDWKKVWLFFSDERALPPDDPNNNYHMAMQAGFSQLPIPKNQIFRMPAEKDIQKGAEEYEKVIEEYVGTDLFDLVMLGMGEDGHTASLFPETAALNISGKAVCANFVPHKDSWRMTLTFDCINNSSNIRLYVLGSSKEKMVEKVFHPAKDSPILPVERVGSLDTPVLWILDDLAAKALLTLP